LTAGCCVDASTSHPLNSASASKHATTAYRGPIASCLLAPLLPFVSRLPAGCRIACCHVPTPCVPFCYAAAARVHPQPLLFVRASWLLRCISSHRLRPLTRRRLTTGCVVAVANAQASSPSSRLQLSPSSHPVELGSSPSLSSLSTYVAIVAIVVSRRAVDMVVVVVDVARCAVTIVAYFAVRCAVTIVIVASSRLLSPVAPSP
jgi:hypothetical protein